MSGAAACDESFGPRPRPTGIDPDTTPSGSTASLLWYEVEPRVVALGADSMRFTVGVSGEPLNVQLSTPAAGIIHLTRTSTGTYSARIAVSDVVFGYRAGDYRNTSSFIEVISAGRTEQTAATVNVRDGSIPLASVQSLSTRVQSASHVVNIRYDDLYSTSQFPPDVLRTFYDFFGDDYDFVVVLEQVQRPDSFSYFAARNNVTGLGLQTFDRAETYGSDARLQGIMHYPNDADYDPAETSFIHELAHRWMNFSNLTNLRIVRPHWPISTLAQGITGYGVAPPATQQSTVFRWQLTPNQNGTFAVQPLPDRPRAFNDFELYLMGLLPPDSVAAHVTFLNQDQRDQLRVNGVLSGPTDTITVGEWVARDGVRVPAYSQSQRSFRMATIVLSRDRLLTRDEMSFYNTIAARAELEEPTPAILRTTRVTTLPFYLATGERGELITRLLAVPGNQP